MERGTLDSAAEISMTAAEVMEGAGNAFQHLLRFGRRLTENGRNIDGYQVVTCEIARWATKLEAAKALMAVSTAAEDVSPSEQRSFSDVAWMCSIDTARQFGQTLEWDFADVVQLPHPVHDYLKRLRERFDERTNITTTAFMGREAIKCDGRNNRFIFAEDETAFAEAAELRETARRFAQEVIAPRAEEIHRQDLLVPEEIIQQIAEMGFFGMSVPVEYGGVGMSNLMMIVATEELSAASLPAAGSLITRPEILAKALLKGGTEKQKQKWLPPVAKGELMVAVAVTEPNVGSDVASITCRADRATVDGREGFKLNGAKAWCTFAGRADILALLARTDPDPGSGHRGLSLFIVEKDPFYGHEFEMVQPTGGRITGKADATMGYRGMHSFTLQFEDYFVPAENLVGEEDGVGKGFYLQMGGFAAGRLQTGGRAVGLAQASLEAAVKYAKERPQFGKPIAEFENTQYEIGSMFIQVEAARQLTYAAARAMDRGDDRADLLAAMAKLFASRVAVDVSQRAQLLHGGWGYAEEYAISRYVADALVLPIFEGVEPILEMKVIGRQLLRGA